MYEHTRIYRRYECVHAYLMMKTRLCFATLVCRNERRTEICFGNLYATLRTKQCYTNIDLRWRYSWWKQLQSRVWKWHSMAPIRGVLSTGVSDWGPLNFKTENWSSWPSSLVTLLHLALVVLDMIRLKFLSSVMKIVCVCMQNGMQPTTIVGLENLPSFFLF